MKSALLSGLLLGATALTSAVAADLPMPVAFPAIFTWTGFYAGSFAGFGIAQGRTDPVCASAGLALCDGFPGRGHADADGFMAGSQVGLNYELPLGLVLGLEADLGFTRLRGTTVGVGDTQPLGPEATALGTAHVTETIDALGTVRGRVGYAFGPALLYATGGLALADVRLDATRADQFGFGVLENSASATDWRTGYVAGGGVEYAFTDHLSGKVEGLYYDLGSRTVAAADPGGVGIVRGARVATDGILVRAGLNYHFDGVPFAGLLRGGLDPAAEPETGTWGVESGVRYFYSTSRYRKVLNDNIVTGQTNSRLTFSGGGDSAGESFVRLDHNPTGLFVKGYLGAGEGSGGRLHDEDFPPAVSPYSDTVSSLHGGDLSYADVDVGYALYRGPEVNLNGFVGYHYLSETMNAYGCSQVAGGPICTTAIPDGTKALSQDAAWNALRVGGQIEARWNRLQVTAEAAYLPVVAMDALDHHWLRPDINPVPEHGTGDGYQVEGVVSYALTPRFSIGAGGRYWYMQAAHGDSQFPGASPSPLKTKMERYGGFAQAAYAFSE